MVTRRQQRRVRYRVPGLQKKFDQLGQCRCWFLSGQVVKDLIGDFLNFGWVGCDKTAEARRTAIALEEHADGFLQWASIAWERRAEFVRQFSKTTSGFLTFSSEDTCKKLIVIWREALGAWFRDWFGVPSNHIFFQEI